MVYQKVFMKEFMQIVMVHYEIILKVKLLLYLYARAEEKIKSLVVQVQ